MKVYVVKMNRWGNNELHSYILGAYNDEYTARLAGEWEQENRDNKYEPEIYECLLDSNIVTITSNERMVIE